MRNDKNLREINAGKIGAQVHRRHHVVDHGEDVGFVEEAVAWCVFDEGLL